jgi:hypothetical protein
MMADGRWMSRIPDQDSALAWRVTVLVTVTVLYDFD